MKKFKSILQLLIFVFSFISCHKSDSKIIVGLSADYPPFEYRVRGEFQGFDVDLAQSLGKELDKEIVFKDMSLAALLPAVESGQVDLGISALTITPQRQKNFDFSKPYHFDDLAVVFHQKAPLREKKDLQGKKIGAQLGSTMQMWAKQNFPQGRVVAMDLNPQLIEALKARQVDAVLMESSQAQAFCEKNPPLAYHVLAKSDNGYGVMLRKGSVLGPPIDQALQNIEKKGVLAKLKRKWWGVQK